MNVESVQRCRSAHDKNQTLVVIQLKINIYETSRSVTKLIKGSLNYIS